MDVEIFKRIRSSPGFLAFSRILGERIEGGRTVEALRMLTDLGADPALAHQIIEGWVREDTRRLGHLGVSKHLEAAIRFAHFIDNVARYNWPELLSRSARAATLVKQEGET